MTTDWQIQVKSQNALLILPWMGLTLLAVLLISLFSGGQGPLFLAAIVAGLGAIWITQKPHWGVWILLALFFTGVSPPLLGNRYLGIPYLISALLLIPLALAVIRDRGIWVWRVPQVKVFLAIGILLLLSTWWNDFWYSTHLILTRDETERQLELFFTRFIFLIFFLYFVTTRQKIELSIWLIVGLIVLSAASALLSFTASGGADRAASDFSLAKNSNRLAFICLFATSLVWFYQSYGWNRQWKALTLPLLFFLPVTAVMTGSRSGLLQMVVLTALAVKEQKGWSPTKRIYSVLLVGCVALLALAIVPSAYLERITSFDPSVHTAGQASLHNRLHVLFVSFQAIAFNPIFGIGIGNYWILHNFFESGLKTHSHNSYMWAILSGGIGTLVLYLSLFFITYRMLRRLEQWGPPELLWASKGLRVNLILFMLFSAFADFWLNFFLYAIVGLTIAMVVCWRRQDRRVALATLARAGVQRR